MFSKNKCPKCGAKNSKERMTCAECGAPLALGQLEGRVSEVPLEGKPNLASTMKQSAIWKRRAWFWVGVTLLSISAYWWVIMVAMGVSTGDWVSAISAGGILTVIPIGIGIYSIWRGRKARALKIQRSPEPTYASQPSVKPTRVRKRSKEKEKGALEKWIDNLPEWVKTLFWILCWILFLGLIIYAILFGEGPIYGGP